MKALIYFNNYFLWWCYRRSEWWRGVVAKRISFLGWLLLGLFFIGTIFGLDVVRNGLGFLSCFCGLLLVLEVIGLLLRRNRVSVRSVPQEVVFAGEEGYVHLEVKAQKRVRKTRLGLYPYANKVDFERFDLAREPRESQRNFVDRGLKYYRWRWLNDDRGFLAKESELLEMEAGEVRGIKLPTTFYERGAWSLVNVRAKLEGELGLLRRSVKTKGKRMELYVAPRVVPVTLCDVYAASRGQDDNFETSPLVGDSQEFLSMREYQPGDSRAKINWKAMARTDKMMIQESEAFAMPRYTIELITEALSEEELEVALSAACSLMLTLSDKGESGQVVITHGVVSRSFDWTEEREMLLRAFASLKHGDQWKSRTDDEPKRLEGIVYTITKNSSGTGEVIRVMGDTINGVPIKEGIIL